MTESLTERQKTWMASVREGLERDTGRSLAEWVVIAKTCPETAPRARLRWFKETHGLMQNRASLVLAQAFPAQMAWDKPDEARAALWTDAGQTAIFEAIEAAVLALPEVVSGQRKGYSAWSRGFQFAAARPVKGGVALGLAVEPDADPRLRAARNEGWSERLKAVMTLTTPGDVDDSLRALMQAAWSRS